MNKCPSVESGMAGKAESCKGCPNADKCASSKPDEDIPIIRSNLKSIKMILAVISGKGGVGKSTIACNIASSLAKNGIKTMILDLDLSGPSVPRLTNTLDEYIYCNDEMFDPITVNKNLKVLSVGHLEDSEDTSMVYGSAVKNFVIKKILKYCRFDDIEVLVIDTPPNITEEHLALANLIKPSNAIVVTTPQNLSLDDVVRQITFCRKVEIKILGIIENMKGFSCTNCAHINKIYNNANAEKYAIDENIPWLGSIPLKTSYAEDSDKGKAIENSIFENIADCIKSKLNDEVHK